MPGVRKHLETAEERLEKAIYSELHTLGVKCIKLVRDLDTYQDQTGNLRSSTFYMIVKDGKVVEDFFSVARKDEGGNGVKNARAHAMDMLNGKGFFQKLFKRRRKGYGLIVGAGMNYAYWVQARGYDVLDSGESFAQREFPRLKARLKIGIAANKK